MLGLIKCNFKFDNGMIDVLNLSNYVYMNNKFYLATENCVYIENPMVK